MKPFNTVTCWMKRRIVDAAEDEVALDALIRRAKAPAQDGILLAREVVGETKARSKVTPSRVRAADRQVVEEGCTAGSPYCARGHSRHPESPNPSGLPVVRIRRAHDIPGLWIDGRGRGRIEELRQEHGGVVQLAVLRLHVRPP